MYGSTPTSKPARRVPTKVIADIEAAGDHVEDIADDLSLDIAQVRAALQHELAA